MPTTGTLPAPKSSRARQLMSPLARAAKYESFDDKAIVQINKSSSRFTRGTPPPAVRTPARAGVYSSGQRQRRETQTQAHRRAVAALARQLKSPPTSDADSGKQDSGDENVERGNWTGRLDFLLSCLGYAVGLGNVWRFPYMCFTNGGGAFLVPYVIFLLLCGIPVFLLDLSLGQFTSEGPATCWQMAPLFNGVGYAMTYLSTMVAIYYNMIIAYAIYYLFASMSSPLPWNGCYNSWNSEYCRHRLPLITCLSENQKENGTCYKGTKLLGLFNETLFKSKTGKSRTLPAEEYYLNQVLKVSDSINTIGTPDWKLALCLAAAWTIVFLCMIRGIKSSGKVVYFTAIFPYVVLVILFFRGVTLSNAGDGIYFYIVPDFTRLADAGVWKAAAGQIFFSLSASWGGLISLASYNRFHNNVIRDTFIVCIANCATSVFAGFVIFSFIGHLAGQLNVPVADVSQSGFGLAFIIYPEAVNMLPGATFWAIIFFFMLLTLGLDSQFAMVETVVTSLCDKYRWLRMRKTQLIAAISVIMFLIGLPFTCNGGTYLMTIVDSYCGSWVILLIGFFECIAIGWVYGRTGFGKFHRFSEDIALIVEHKIWPCWRYLWQFVSPSLIAGIIIFNWVKYKRTEYVAGTGNYYPIWADIFGWVIAITSVIIIIGTGLYKFLSEPSDDSLYQRLVNVSIPTYRWGPALPQHRQLMAPYLRDLGALDNFYLNPQKKIKYTEVFGNGVNQLATIAESCSAQQSPEKSTTTTAATAAAAAQDNGSFMVEMETRTAVNNSSAA